MDDGRWTTGNRQPKLTASPRLVIVFNCATNSHCWERRNLKNLLGRLMSRPLDELRAISASWGTLTRDASPTQNDLAIAVYHTMVDASAVRGIWESLDVEE